MSRILRVVVLAIFLVGVVAGCEFGEPSMSAGEVEAHAIAEFSQQFPVDSVGCDEDLPARVGASITCVLVSEGNAFEMTVTTTEVDGDEIDFHMELTDEL